MVNFLNKLIKKYLTESIIEKGLYLIFGVFTTFVNIITYFICTSILNLNYMPGSVISWIIAVSFAFITNKLFVFKSNNTEAFGLLKEAGSFLVFRLLSLLIDLATMYIFIEIVNINDILAKIVANVLVIIINYFASKLIIFKM